MKTLSALREAGRADSLAGYPKTYVEGQYALIRVCCLTTLCAPCVVAQAGVTLSVAAKAPSRDSWGVLDLAHDHANATLSVYARRRGGCESNGRVSQKHNMMVAAITACWLRGRPILF